jgi:hypothetical protein
MSGHWVYKEEVDFEVPDGAFGFVYRIVNTQTGKKYIGKKKLSKTVSKTAKKKDGTKSLRKKKVVSESNWRAYMGSCQDLLNDISVLGKSYFTFEVLGWAFSQGQLSYLEEYVQFRTNAILDESYYNDSIGARGYIGLKKEDRFLQQVLSITV